MSVSPSILGLGLTLTGLGTLLLLLSLKNKSDSKSSDIVSKGIIFFGPIPIIFGGRNKWAIAVVVVSVMIVVYIAAVMAQPEIVGL